MEGVMEFNSNDHVYKIIPDMFGNKESDDPAVFHLKGISQEDFSKAVRAEALIGTEFTPEKAAEHRADNAAKMIADRVVKIENFVVDGKEITDYAGLCKHAPRELVNWIVACVHSTERLTEEEIKN